MQSNSLLPVELTVAKEAVLLQLAGQAYSIKINPMAKKQLANAHSYLLNIIQQPVIASYYKQIHLLLLGQSLLFPLPESIVSLAATNGISQKKLLKVSKNKMGYLLPTADNIGGVLQFTNGQTLPLPILSKLADGPYSVAITAKNQQLRLQVTPIQTSIPINLGAPVTTSEPVLAVTTPMPAADTVKTDASVNYKLLFQALNTLSTTNAKSTLEQQLPNADKASSPQPHFLMDALTKAGGLPPNSQPNKSFPSSLASALFKLMPNLSPNTLSSLSEPKLLRQELLGAMSHNIDPSTWSSNPNTHISTVSLLCQLLIGRRVSHQPSVDFTAKIAQLQATLGLPDQFLALMDNERITQPLKALINNVSLYQQHSGAVDGVNHWYFTIPYSVNHYQEQFEGHIEQQKNQTNGEQTWKLRLKFNLSSGPLLVTVSANTAGITARALARNTNEAKHRDNNALQLAVNFTSDNQELLTKINMLSPSLSKKITQLGLSITAVNTQLQAVAATLLPGDHYLIKVNV
ncbi:hypothetical protein [Shewanella youngdeokensis]|uniref:Flagellar hook-length control protein-like C-terminal domain-containing protein n=1 Tax=Shewanella youngdeokensis TaxID=2999068 RepID=A0ABZ0K155_9GAMM|nr:hypothetical protein RGE70_05610 [Shewanella sp. DAU334]